MDAKGGDSMGRIARANARLRGATDVSDRRKLSRSSSGNSLFTWTSPIIFAHRYLTSLLGSSSFLHPFHRHTNDHIRCSYQWKIFSQHLRGMCVRYHYTWWFTLRLLTLIFEPACLVELAGEWVENDEATRDRVFYRISFSIL